MKLGRCTIWSHGSIHSSAIVYFKRRRLHLGTSTGKVTSLASSNFPCDLRIKARLPTDWSVWGCCGPSWDSRPASAERCSSAAWRLEVAPLVRHYKLAKQASGNLCSQCDFNQEGTVGGSRRCHTFSQHAYIYIYTWTLQCTQNFGPGPKKKPAPFLGLQGPFLILEGEPSYTQNSGASEAPESHE